ncbi:MAG: toprim domain-containing protein [Actinobacteria bacterium]|nr:toprim domain-containing protein [Actinomycetota bacterium]
MTNTVGLMGTAVTEHHLMALRRLAPTAVIAFDGDDAGADAIVRTGAQARAAGIELRVAVLPTDIDPADLLQHEGPDALRRLTETSTSLARFHVERELHRADLTTAEGKDALVDAVRIAFTWLPSSVLREELIATIAKRLGVAASLVATWMPVADMTGATGLRVQPEPPAPSSPPSPAVHDLLRAREVLLRCIAVPDSAPDLLDDAQIAAMPTELHERAARHIREHAADPTCALPHDDHEFVSFIGALLSTLAPVAQSEISPRVGETGG